MEMHGFNLGKEYRNFEHLSFTPHSKPIVALLPSRGCFFMCGVGDAQVLYVFYILILHINHSAISHGIILQTMAFMLIFSTNLFIFVLSIWPMTNLKVQDTKTATTSQ